MPLRSWVWALLVAAMAVAAPPDENPVALKIGKIAVPAVRAGDSVSVAIPLTIARGYHVNANPAAGEDYIPLEILLTDSAGVRVGSVIYPDAKTWRLEGGTEDLLMYDGRFEVRVPLHVAPDAPVGEHVLSGMVEYQACNRQICLMPDSRPLRLAVRILPAL